MSIQFVSQLSQKGWYPSEADQLQALLQQWINSEGAGSGSTWRALILPHAGYFYSGDIAFSGLRLLNFEKIKIEIKNISQ